MKNNLKKYVLNAIDILGGLGVFALALWLWLGLATSCDAREASVVLENGREVQLPVIQYDELYVDSHGAEAYGWEIEEAIRKIMLEAGGEGQDDIRAHVEVDLKQLLYCQTVGGYDDWGTSLYGVTHSHGYLETNTRLWTKEAEPTDLVRAIWWDVWNNGYFSDFRVQNYRSGWYHSLTWSTPAYQIGRSFYSINIWQDFSMFDLDENGVLRY
jgi:hypothetical protein